VKTILVLEDEPSLMILLRRVLGRYGYATLEAANAEEAIEQFSHSGQRIDLLMADVSLPGMSGVQLALLLRAEHPGLSVILTSGYPPNSWSVRNALFLKRLGTEGVSILLKPFIPRTLVQTITDLIEGSAPEVLRAAN
jgi:CheY-like chemotaxis protein